jgi:hypothetical protein
MNIFFGCLVSYYVVCYTVYVDDADEFKRNTNHDIIGENVLSIVRSVSEQ